MNTLKFKTTLKDQQDFEKLSSSLKEVKGIVECYCINNDPRNLLIVKSEGINKDTVSRAIFNAGFRNELKMSGWQKATGKLFKKDCCKQS